jgi:TatA/E family protein of Tat protein translocase
MSAGEIVLILFVYLLFFGAKGIPSLAQTLGKAVYQFRNAAKDVQDEIMSSANEIKKEVQNNVRLDQMDMEEEHPTSERTRPIPQRKEPIASEEKRAEPNSTDSTTAPKV